MPTAIVLCTCIPSACVNIEIFLPYFFPQQVTGLKAEWVCYLRDKVHKTSTGIFRNICNGSEKVNMFSLSTLTTIITHDCYRTKSIR